MPRYFFDLQDQQNARDPSGTELADDAAARVEALVFAGAYLRDHPDLVWDGHEIRVHVFDHRGEPLFLVAILGIDLQRPSPVRLVKG